MTENVKKLMELVSTDGEDAVERMNKANQEELIALAAEKGITLTEEDFKPQSVDLSDDEVESVAGGAVCGCAVGGYGKEGDFDEQCSCAMYGSGEGDTRDYKVTFYDSEKQRCFCIVGGGGKSLD